MVLFSFLKTVKNSQDKIRESEMDCLTTCSTEVLILKVLGFVVCAVSLLLVVPHLLDERCIREVTITSQICPCCVHSRGLLKLSCYLCVQHCESGLMI